MRVGSSPLIVRTAGRSGSPYRPGDGSGASPCGRFAGAGGLRGGFDGLASPRGRLSPLSPWGRTGPSRCSREALGIAERSACCSPRALSACCSPSFGEWTPRPCCPPLRSPPRRCCTMPRNSCTCLASARISPCNASIGEPAPDAGPPLDGSARRPCPLLGWSPGEPDGRFPVFPSDLCPSFSSISGETLMPAARRCFAASAR